MIEGAMERLLFHCNVRCTLTKFNLSRISIMMVFIVSSLGSMRQMATASGIVVESTSTPGQCELFAEQGDTLSIMYTEAYGDADQSASKQTMITLGDPGINRGWNDGLPGTCLNELRKLIVPALVAFSRLPPHLSSNVNITYLIKIVEIEKPKFPSMDKLFQFEEMFISTIIMVTEETLPGERNDGIDEEDPDINRTDVENGRRKTSPPKDQQEVDVAMLVFYLQLAAIPVVILLVLIIAYYIYKIKYPHKRTTFFKRETVCRQVEAVALGGMPPS